jgi:hypothetical protein
MMSTSAKGQAMAETERANKVARSAERTVVSHVPVIVGVSDAPVSMRHDALDFAVAEANSRYSDSDLVLYKLVSRWRPSRRWRRLRPCQSGILRAERWWPSPPRTRAAGWTPTRRSGPSAGFLDFLHQRL